MHEPTTDPDPDGELATVSLSAAGSDEVLAAGDLVGRFRIERLLGTGGMGRVYAARDPHLDRAVALKLLRGGPWSGGQEHLRMLREARAMARLRHANVVTVHEVGEHQGQPYIAMELLEGSTLSDWLRAAPRGWREIRDVFVAAGHGLAAAHEAGLVHRDFKPANVLIGPRGVRVADFGLVLHAGDAGTDADARSPAVAEVDLTHPGGVPGTLPYLAPEQLAGGRATPASDQWSFCTALHEALYRELPFAGKTADQRRAALDADLTLRAGAPRFLQAILRRGLAVEPAARYPSMAALLRELDRDPGRTARLVSLGAGALVVAALGVVVAWPEREAPCQGARAHLAGVWDPPAQAALHAAFAATGKPFADDRWARTSRRLDDYADGWVREHTAACEAAQVRGEQSAELLDRRMQCLDRLRDALGTWVSTTTRTLDAAGLQRVVGATSLLGSTADCGGASLLGRAPLPADPAAREAVTRLGNRLEEQRVRGQLGAPLPAEAAVAALIPEIEATGYKPLLARALFNHAQLLSQTDKPDAVARYEQAVRAAEEARDDRQAALAWVSLLLALGDERRPDEALRLLIAAEAAVRRAADPYVARELDMAVALAERRQGKLDEARRRMERAMPLYDRPTDGLLRARNIRGLAQIAAEQQDAPALLEASRRLVAEAAAAVGPDHPMSASAHQSLGAALMQQGETAAAERELLEAVRVYRLVLGEDSMDAANTMGMVSYNRMRAGKLDEAMQAVDECIAILERSPRPTTQLANNLEQRGNIEQYRGNLAAARAAFERSLEVRRRVLGEDDPALGLSHSSIASVLMDEGRPAEAVATIARARAIYARRGVKGPRLALLLGQLAESLIAAGRPREALAVAREAEPHIAAGDATLLARGDFHFAQAEWANGHRAAARGRGVAAQVRCASGRVDRQLCERIDDWLARHRR